MKLRMEGFVVSRGRMVFYYFWELFFLSALDGDKEKVCAGSVQLFVTF